MIDAEKGLRILIWVYVALFVLSIVAYITLGLVR